MGHWGHFGGCPVEELVWATLGPLWWMLLWAHFRECAVEALVCGLVWAPFGGCGVEEMWCGRVSLGGRTEVPSS